VVTRHNNLWWRCSADKNKHGMLHPTVDFDPRFQTNIRRSCNSQGGRNKPYRNQQLHPSDWITCWNCAFTAVWPRQWFGHYQLINLDKLDQPFFRAWDWGLTDNFISTWLGQRNWHEYLDNPCWVLFSLPRTDLDLNWLYRWNNL